MIFVLWPTWTDVWLIPISDRSNFFDDVCVDLRYERTEDSSSTSPRPSCRSVVTVYSRDSQDVSTCPSCWSWENLSTLGLDTRRVVVSLDLGSEMLSCHVYTSFKDGAKIRIHIVSVIPKYTVVLRFHLDEFRHFFVLNLFLFCVPKLVHASLCDSESNYRCDVLLSLTLLLISLNVFSSRSSSNIFWYSKTSDFTRVSLILDEIFSRSYCCALSKINTVIHSVVRS